MGPAWIVIGRCAIALSGHEIIERSQFNPGRSHKEGQILQVRIGVPDEQVEERPLQEADTAASRVRALIDAGNERIGAGLLILNWRSRPSSWQASMACRRVPALRCGSDQIVGSNKRHRERSVLQLLAREAPGAQRAAS